MRVLLVRCQNGLVVWRLSATRATHTTNARCLNDGFFVSKLLLVDTDAVDFLQAIATKSSALRGPIQSVTQLDLPQ